MPRWAMVVPAAAALLLLAGLALPMGTAIAIACASGLIGAVIAAVHHAEVVAHRVGEPFGTLVLAVAITVIEVGLILSMMLAGGPDKAALPRDTIFAAVMIICNGVVGVFLLLGGLRHHEQSFRIESANSGLAALIALATLSLVLPTFTTSSPGPTYTVPQLAFSGLRRWPCGRYTCSSRPSATATTSCRRAMPPTRPRMRRPVRGADRARGGCARAAARVRLTRQPSVAARPVQSASERRGRAASEA